MKKVLLIAFLGMSCHVFSQYSIKGKVKDIDGKPLVGANVGFENSILGSVTNENGEFEIKKVEKGEHKLVVSFMGYEEFSQIVTINADTDLDLRLKLKEILAEEIIIKGVRAGERAPVSQKTLHKAAILNEYNGEHPVFFIGDLTPSVVTESESGTSFSNYGSLRLRGLNQHRINFTLNGIPLNDMIDHGVYFSNFTDIANSFESVEVQRGVGTVSNGVASYAGSINFESINLEKRAQGTTFQLGYGSFNSYRMNAQVNSGIINEKWTFHGSYNRLYSDGYKDNTQTEAHSFFFSGAYLGKKNTFKLNAFDARSQNGLGYQAVDLATIKSNPTFNPLNENDMDNFGQQFVQLQHIYKYSKDLYLVNSLYFNGAGGDFPWGFVDSVLIQINYPLTNKHYGFISNLSYQGIDDLDLSFGMHTYTFRRNNLEQISPDYKNPYYDEKSQKDELSLFIKANYRLGSFNVYGNLQFRDATLKIHPDYNYLGINNEGRLMENWIFVNPSIGVVYEIYNNTRIYASVGKTSREPRKVDILGGFGLYDTAKYNQLRNNIDFLHENVIDYEIGIKRSSINYSANINAFFMDFKNGILESGETIEFGSKLRSNVPNSQRTGVELSMDVSPINKLTFSLNSTFMKSKVEKFKFQGDSVFTKGLIPILSPEIIINGNVSYSIFSNLKIDLSSKFISESYMSIDNNEDYTIPSFFLMNGRIHYYFMKKHSFAIEINNLTNTEYFTNGAPVDTNGDWINDSPGYFANAPINIFATLSLNF